MPLRRQGSSQGQDRARSWRGVPSGGHAFDVGGNRIEVEQALAPELVSLPEAAALDLPFLGQTVEGGFSDSECGVRKFAIAPFPACLLCGLSHAREYAERP